MIVAGFGFRAAATVSSLEDALDRTGRALEVHALATASDKAETPAFAAMAALAGLPVLAIDGDRLRAQDTETQSPDSLAARGTGSVAEAAALAAAGPGARLIAPRVVSADKMATCALAQTAKGDDT